MRLFVLLLSLLLVEQAYAVQFNRCIDSQGNVLFTNLPLSALDANCQQKLDSYNRNMQNDYQQLKQQLQASRNKPVMENKAVTDMVATVKEGFEKMLDSDAALEELLQNTRDARENSATRFFRARTEAVNKILQADKP